MTQEHYRIVGYLCLCMLTGPTAPATLCFSLQAVLCTGLRLCVYVYVCVCVCVCVCVLNVREAEPTLLLQLALDNSAKH